MCAVQRCMVFDSSDDSTSQNNAAAAQRAKEQRRKAAAARAAAHPPQLFLTAQNKMCSTGTARTGLQTSGLARPSLIPSPCTHFTRAGIVWRRLTNMPV